jgi:hypothetical protein
VAETRVCDTPKDSTLACWVQVVEECRRREYDKVVVVQNKPGSLTCFDMYELMERLQAIKPPSLKVAFVDPDPGRRAVSEFGETVAVNRGLSARYFDSVTAAESWLGTGA